MVEAKTLAEKIGFIGGGVTGIYVPAYGGDMKTPIDGEKCFYHFRFANGATGINAGLVRELMKMCRTTWPAMLARDVMDAPREDQ